MNIMAQTDSQGPTMTGERLRVLIEHFPGGVLFEDEARRVELVNDRLPRLFGMTALSAEIIGSDCRDLAGLVAPVTEAPEAFVENIEACIAKGESVLGERIFLERGWS